MGGLLLAWRGRDLTDRRIFWSLYGDDEIWTPQQQVQAAEAETDTYSSPALGIGPGRHVRMAWRRSGHERQIYTGVWSGPTTGWTTVRPVRGAESQVAPALATGHDYMSMAWRGPHLDQQIYWSEGIFNVTSYTIHQVPWARTATGVTLASHRGKLHLAFKGAENDQIYWSVFGDQGWGSPRPIPDRGTSGTPALGVAGHNLYMAWRGINERQLYWSVYDGHSGWSPQAPIPGFTSPDSPTLAGSGGRLYMAWQADHPGLPFFGAGIHWSFTTGTHWAPKRVLAGAGTFRAPAIAGWD